MRWLRRSKRLHNCELGFADIQLTALRTANYKLVLMEPIEFESTTCACCDCISASPQDRIEWLGETLQFVVCDGCGLKYMKPRPTRSWYRAFYASKFWDDKTTGTDWSSKGARKAIDPEAKLAKLDKRAAYVMEAISDIGLPAPNECVLDIGAGFGSVASRLREVTGCKVLAIEPSDIARAHLAKLSIKVVGRYAEDILEPQPFDGTVDVILFCTSLENINDPRAVLAASRRLLSTKGRVVVITPNLHTYNAINPYHPYVFAPETLALLFGRAGLDVVSCSIGNTGKWREGHFVMLGTPAGEAA